MQTNELSILESDYVKPHRPISNDELKSRYKKYMNKFKLSSEMVYHNNTRYFYHVKKYGKKEKEILEKKENKDENYNHDIGNCSVSWRLSQTPKHLKKTAHDIVNEYMKVFNQENDQKYSDYDLELMRVFYTWLYFEGNNNNNRNYNNRNDDRNYNNRNEDRNYNNRNEDRNYNNRNDDRNYNNRNDDRNYNNRNYNNEEEEN